MPRTVRISLERIHLITSALKERTFSKQMGITTSLVLRFGTEGTAVALQCLTKSSVHIFRGTSRFRTLDTTSFSRTSLAHGGRHTLETMAAERLGAKNRECCL